MPTFALGINPACSDTTTVLMLCLCSPFIYTHLPAGTFIRSGLGRHILSLYTVIMHRVSNKRVMKCWIKKWHSHKYSHKAPVDLYCQHYHSRHSDAWNEMRADSDGTQSLCFGMYTHQISPPDTFSLKLEYRVCPAQCLTSMLLVRGTANASKLAILNHFFCSK